jgi:hypothetical protein
MMNDWWQAFLLTQWVEIPVYLYAGRLLPGANRILLAVGASSVTHPIVWFAFPWQEWPYLPTAMAAECFAIVTEALLCYLAGIKRPILWSLLANGSSVAIGVALRWFIDWP